MLSSAARAGGGERPPNILFILVDDLGWADLGCYGNKFNETPRMDELAAQGMRFTDAYASCPVCSPTRASLLSGQYQQRFGVGDFIPGHWRPFEKLKVPENADAMPLDVTTIPEALAPRGYTSANVGKWHLGHGPKKQGFDVATNAWSTPTLTKRARRFMKQNRDNPFLLYFSPHSVHIPLEAPAELVAKYQEKKSVPGRLCHPVYAAVLEELDRSVGRLLDTLEELNLAENTLVMLFSDNGGMYKSYVGGDAPVTNNGPLRGEKGTLYEGGIRVPFIVRWPGRVQAGSVCREPVISNDVYPTLLSAADAPKPSDHTLDGADLTPLLRNTEDELEREALYWHYPYYHHSTPAGAIRSGPWKLIEFFEDHSLELYNLEEDIGEQNNLDREKPDRAARLQSRLRVWRKDVGARMPAPNPKHDPGRADEWWNRRTGKPLDKLKVQKRLRTRWPVEKKGKK
jgi:uncharacterized sulfatase